jgi:hypothetical protein
MLSSTMYGILIGAGFGLMYGTMSYMIDYSHWWDGTLYLDTYNIYTDCVKPSRFRIVGWATFGAVVGYGFIKLCDRIIINI